MSFFKKIYCRLTGNPYSEKEISEQIISKIREGGGHVGNNVDIFASSFDLGEPYYISIGDNVTITGVKVLTHDASTKKILGYTKTGKVHIGNDVFIGWGSIILPGTTIGDRVIIGAGSVVAKDVPNNVIVCGNPLRVICAYDEYIEKNRSLMKEVPVIDLLPRDIMSSEESKRRLIESGFGYLL